MSSSGGSCGATKESHQDQDRVAERYTVELSRGVIATATGRSVQSWIDDGRGDLTLNGPVGATSTGFGPRHVAVGSVSVPRSLSLSLSLSRPPLSLPLALTQHPPSLSVPCQMSVFHLRRTIRRIRFHWRSQGDIVPKLYACVFVTVDEGGGCELYCCGDPKVPEAYIEPPSVPVA